MKKSLAIICAVAVLITTLCGTFLLSSASAGEYSEAVIPGFATNHGKGEAITPVIGEAVGEDVILKSGGGATIGKFAENTSSIPFPALIEFGHDDVVPSEWGSYFNFYLDDTAVAGKGYIFYVEAPASTPFSIYAYGSYNDNQMFRGNAGNGAVPYMYALEEDDTEWQQLSYASNGYRVEVPAGFKGYVYSPFRFLSSSNYANTPKASAGDLIDCGFYNGFITINEGEKALLSAPIIVAGNPTDDTLPAVKGITFGGVNYDFFGEPVGEDKEPVYDSIPKDVSIAEVAELKSQLAYGMGIDDIPLTTLNTNVAKSAGFDVNVVAPVGISGRPAIKVTGGTGAADAELGLPTIYFHDNKKPATALMFYIDSTDAERKYYPVMGTKDANGADQYTQTYNGKVWIMADGATEWTEIPISAYYFTLPAGFKGSVKLDYTNYKFYYGPEVTGVHQLGLKTIGTIASGDAIVIGNPVHITRDCFNNKFILGSIVDANSNNVIGNIDGVVDIPAVTPPADETTDFLEGATEIFAPKGQLTISGSTGTLTEIESICPVTDNKSAKVTGYTSGTIADFKFSEKADKAIGVIVYVKTSTPNPEFKIATGAWVYGANGVEDGTYKWPSTSYASGQMYYLAKGATKWEQTKAASQTYHRQIPAPNGFEGYIYFPFNSNVAQNVKCESAIVEYVYAQMVANTGDVEMSSWMNVKSFNPDTVYATIGTEKCIDMLTGDGYKAPDGSSSDDTSSGGSSDDTSSGGSSDNTSSGGSSSGGSEPAPTQPDYKADPYTGAAIDYSKFSIQNVTVGKLNAVVEVGKEVPKAALTSPKSDSKGIVAGTITAIDNKLAYTKYPMFKINKTSGTPVDGVAFASFSLDAAVSPKNPVEILYYVEVPTGEDIIASAQWNFYNEADLAYYNIMYNGSCSLMATGEKEWKQVSVSAYNFTIPAGFKGYVKFAVRNIHAQDNSPAGGKDTFLADTNKVLKSTSLFLYNLNSNQDVYLSAPLLVTKAGSVPYVAFVDGETNAARNLFTGKVMTANDLKEFAGVEGNENLNQGEAPAIDYKIPAYKGTKYEYGNYEFARIRQYVLAKNVAKGYIIPQEAFTDGHADKNNDYTKLVDTTLGISKMPLFSITKSTGDPTQKNIALGTWHPDYRNEANKGAGAIMQYLKLPKDLESPMVQLTFNFYNEKLVGRNVAPYNDVVYYMQKGTTEWVSTKVTAYWFELPKGFEGYIMMETAKFSHQGGGDGADYSPNWVLYNYNVNIPNLKNQTVVASAPFLLDKKGDIDYAAYLNDEKNAVRNIFTGKVLKKEDVIKPLKIGDTLVKLPDYTTDFSAAIADKAALSSGTAVVEWDSIDNATKYVVRVFKKVNTDDGIAYNFVAEAETTDTKATINDLELNTQYAIVVYAYDAKNNEIAVFDYINASTAAGATNAPVKPSTPTTPGVADDDDDSAGFPWILVAAIAAGVIVLAAVAVVVIVIVAKKRKAKAE